MVKPREKSVVLLRYDIKKEINETYETTLHHNGFSLHNQSLNTPEYGATIL